jgi:hypothetical protein
MMLLAYSTFFARTRMIGSQSYTYEVLARLNDHKGSFCDVFPDVGRHGGP